MFVCFLNNHHNHYLISLLIRLYPVDDYGPLPSDAEHDNLLLLLAYPRIVSSERLHPLMLVKSPGHGIRWNTTAGLSAPINQLNLN